MRLLLTTTGPTDINSDARSVVQPRTEISIPKVEGALVNSEIGEDIEEGAPIQHPTQNKAGDEVIPQDAIATVHGNDVQPTAKPIPDETTLAVEPPHLVPELPPITEDAQPPVIESMTAETSEDERNDELTIAPTAPLHEPLSGLDDHAVQPESQEIYEHETHEEQREAEPTPVVISSAQVDRELHDLQDNAASHFDTETPVARAELDDEPFQSVPIITEMSESDMSSITADSSHEVVDGAQSPSDDHMPVEVKAITTAAEEQQITGTAEEVETHHDTEHEQPLEIQTEGLPIPTIVVTGASAEVVHDATDIAVNRDREVNNANDTTPVDADVPEEEPASDAVKETLPAHEPIEQSTEHVHGPEPMASHVMDSDLHTDDDSDTAADAVDYYEHHSGLHLNEDSYENDDSVKAPEIVPAEHEVHETSSIVDEATSASTAITEDHVDQPSAYSQAMQATLPAEYVDYGASYYASAAQQSIYQPSDIHEATSALVMSSEPVLEHESIRGNAHQENDVMISDQDSTGRDSDNAGQYLEAESLVKEIEQREPVLGVQGRVSEAENAVTAHGQDSLLENDSEGLTFHEHTEGRSGDVTEGHKDDTTGLIVEHTPRYEAGELPETPTTIVGTLHDEEPVSSSIKKNTEEQQEQETPVHSEEPADGEHVFGVVPAEAEQYVPEHGEPNTPESDRFSEPQITLADGNPPNPERLADSRHSPEPEYEKHLQMVPTTPPRPALPGRAEWETPAYSDDDIAESTMFAPRDVTNMSWQGHGVEATPGSMRSEATMSASSPPNSPRTGPTGSDYENYTGLDEPFVRSSQSSTPDYAPHDGPLSASRGQPLAKLDYGHVMAVDEKGFAIETDSSIAEEQLQPQASERPPLVLPRSRPSSIATSNVFQKMRSMFEPPDAGSSMAKRDSVSSSTSQLSTPRLKQVPQPSTSAEADKGYQDEDDEADAAVSERSSLLQSATTSMPTNYY